MGGSGRAGPSIVVKRKQEGRTRREGTTSISSLSTLLLSDFCPRLTRHKGFDERSARIYYLPGDLRTRVMHAAESRHEPAQSSPRSQVSPLIMNLFELPLDSSQVGEILGA